MEKLRARAERADVEAQNALGSAYTEGQGGVKQDYVEALKWFRQAADKGFAAAQYNLGLAYELGHGVPADDREAFKYYLMAAEQGFAAAQFNVGNMYATGRGAGQDLFEANLWFKQAADKGIVEAQFNLGLAYEAGRGVKKDETQAARWYKQAADRGFPRAQYNLGLLLEDGRGVGKNEPAAAAYYRAAAEQGFAAAQNNYGLMFSEGRGGLAKDPVQAWVWLSLAAENGASPAARDFVARSLSADQRAAALRQLEDRRAGKVPAMASTAPVSSAHAVPAARVADLAAELEKAREANTQFAQANQELEAEKARLMQQVAAGGGDNQNLIDQLRAQSQRLANQVQTLTVDKEAAEREVALLAVQVKDARQDLARAKPGAPAAEASRYESQVADLTAKLTQATTTLTQLQAANQQLTEGNTRLQQEKESLAANAPKADAPAGAEQAAIIANLQRDNARLNDEVKRATRELLSLNTQLRSLRNQPPKPAPAADDPAAGQQLAELTAKAEQAAQEATRVQAENSRLAARLTELENQPKPVPDETAANRLREQVATLQRDNAEWEKRSRSLAQTITEKSALADGANSGLADVRRELDQQQQQLAAALAENRALATRAAQAEQALAVQAARKPDTTAVEALQQQLAGVQQQAEKLSQEKQALTDQVAAEHRSFIEAQSRVAQAEQALAAQAARKPDTTAVEALQQQLADVQQQAEKLSQEKQALTDQVAAEHRSFIEAQTRVAQAEQALAAQAARKPDTTAVEALQQQLAGVQQEAGKLSQDKQALADKVAEEHRSFIQAQTRVAVLERDLREAQKSAGNPAELANLKKQLVEAGEALDQSGAAVAELTGVNDRLEKDLAAARQGAAEAGAQRDELAKLRREAAAVAALREENSRLARTAEAAAALRTKNDQLIRDGDQLAARLTSTQRDLQTAQARVAEMERSAAEIPMVRTREADDTRKLQADLAEANATVEKLTATVAELTGANDRLEKDLDNARKSTDAALAAQSQAVSAAQPDAYQMEISTLSARVKELEGQIEEERSNSAREVSTLAAQLTRTRETNKSLTEANRALLSAQQSEGATVDKEQFDAVQARVRELTAAGEELKRQNQRLATDNQGLLADRTTIRQQLEEARQVATTLPGLSDERAALQERLEAVGSQLVKAQQDLDTLQNQNAEVTARAVANQTAAEQARADLAALQGRAAEAEKASESHTASVAELTQANTRLEQEREDMRRLVESYRADIARLTQNVRNAEQLRAEGERGAQQNIDAVTAQLGQLRRDLETTRTAQARQAEASAAQDRDRVAVITQLRTENGALAARLTQAQSTLDQIASAARLGTPASVIAAGGQAPTRPVVTAPDGPAVEARIHTVTEGDSLSRISMRYYGTANRWQEIFNANRDVLQGSSTLRVGMQLRIP